MNKQKSNLDSMLERVKEEREDQTLIGQFMRQEGGDNPERWDAFMVKMKEVSDEIKAGAKYSVPGIVDAVEQHFGNPGVFNVDNLKRWGNKLGLQFTSARRRGGKG